MKGAIRVDIIGSTYEGDPVKRKEIEAFPEGTTFTDDTVLTIAVADAILNGTPCMYHRWDRGSLLQENSGRNRAQRTFIP